MVSGGLWAYRIRQVDIPEDRTVFVIFFLAAVGLGVTALVKGTGWGGRAAAVVAIGIGLLLPFTVAISRQEAAPNVIRVGGTIPSFQARDDQGQLFDSKSLKDKLVLMKFFRAHW